MEERQLCFYRVDTRSAKNLWPLTSYQPSSLCTLTGIHTDAFSIHAWILLEQTLIILACYATLDRRSSQIAYLWRTKILHHRCPHLWWIRLDVVTDEATGAGPSQIRSYPWRVHICTRNVWRAHLSARHKPNTYDIFINLVHQKKGRNNLKWLFILPVTGN